MPDNMDDQLDFIGTARKRFAQAQTDEEPLRAEYKKNIAFVAGDQWDEQVKAARIKAGRPVLTFNRSHTFVQQVANEARQNKPEIKFVPQKDEDKDTAEVYEGLARHIQYSSDAQIAYETAVECSAGGGFGYFRFLTDYCNDEDFDQDLNVIPVLDPLAVYGALVPACYGQQPNHVFIPEDVPRDEFKLLYPDSKIVALGFDEASSQCSGWIGTETVRVSEYWYVEQTPKEIKKGDQTRTVMQKKVKFCKISGMEVLPGTETEWVGSTIPIVPVLGKLMMVDGKPRLFSVISFQRDPQQLINAYKTRIAETLGTAPIQPYIVAEGQIAGREAEWATLNSTQRPYLTYKSVDVQGKPAPAPQRQVFEPPIASLSEAAAQEIDDMKATAGIYDASLGSQGNEQSGIAIARRNQQSDVTNLHFMDNLERSFKKGGLIIAEVLPKIYDTERMVRILGKDEAPEIVKINAQYQDANGKSKHYKVGGDDVGKYEVIVTMGRSYSSKRMESYDFMTQLVQSAPNTFPLIADVMFRNSDTAGADILAERFHKMLPPQLQDDNDQPIPPQVQAQMAQMQQQNQMLTQELHAAAQALETKQLELSSKERIEQMKIDAQLAIAEIETKAQNVSERLKWQQQLESMMHDAAHDVGIQAQDHANSMQAQQAQAQNQQVAQAQQQEGAMQQQQAAQQASQQPSA